jgi:hypothetical protein
MNTDITPPSKTVTDTVTVFGRTHVLVRRIPGNQIVSFTGGYDAYDGAMGYATIPRDLLPDNGELERHFSPHPGVHEKGYRIWYTDWPADPTPPADPAEMDMEFRKWAV